MEKRIMIDLGRALGRLHIASAPKDCVGAPDIVARLEIVRASDTSDEFGFIPPQSVSIYGVPNLATLRDALIEGLKGLD